MARLILLVFLAQLPVNSDQLENYVRRAMVVTQIDAEKECQYSDICSNRKCGSKKNPGKFDRTDTGLKCENYGVVILYEDILEAVDKSEGSHRGGLDTADKIDDAHNRYLKTPKGKTALRKYATSDKGKEVHRRHESTDKGKLTKKLYYQSDKGQEAHKKASERRKLVTRISKWMSLNPGKTSNDYFAAFPDELKIME